MLILSQYQIKTPKFQVYENLVGSWTLKNKMKKRAEDSKVRIATLGDAPYNEISPSVTANDP